METIQTNCENCGKVLIIIRDNKNTKTYHCKECKIKFELKNRKKNG